MTSLHTRPLAMHSAEDEASDYIKPSNPHFHIHYTWENVHPIDGIGGNVALFIFLAVVMVAICFVTLIEVQGVEYVESKRI